MSLKENNQITEQEKQRRRYLHFLRTLQEMGYEEVKQGEYHRAKQENYGVTARIGFKFFKLKPKLRICHACGQEIKEEII